MLKKLINLIVLPLFALTSIALVQAAEVGKLDEADIAVSSRANDVKDHGLKEALAAVFIKNSGLPSVVLNPLVKAQINTPEVILTQYGYYEKNGELMLKASFDHQRIISTLRQAGLPVWGSQRPLTLLWMSVNENNEPTVLADASSADIRIELAQESTNKGIPLLLPIMDLDDVMQVSITDVRGMFTDVLANASARYQADYFAVANVDTQGGNVHFSFKLFDKNRTNGVLQALISQQGNAADYKQATKQMMNILADYYISQYAIASTGNDVATQVSFTGLNNITQVVHVETYLRQLSAVKSIKLSQFKGDSATYSIALFSSVDDLQRLLNIDSRLSQLDTKGSVESFYESKTDNTKPKLIYQWLG
ncbi:DUF2066 domain-containing protein [Shewanella psychromarinicola]|uniref:DUF2066 domain-containing protein n=1 Tax=Shewanella psychromarinicola TaxID=2487742 RepID=A0A3N4EC31_9GAMM|nr:DUF2066 domain-containing protein [Shewanella psychromarinicola]AZG36569.1 DUF2066 domain-containing protein [Shewanella psychromarinicola]MCL1083269.1 DUF2066 domain-containing protein [Shewanella psychromarinicola]RPA34416.1 DUF2066 domain-containing protein [Shewanella psychromarinicola]